MTLHLRDVPFEVASARWVGRLVDDLTWYLHVATVPRQLAGERWAPSIKSEDVSLRFDAGPDKLRVIPTSSVEEAPVTLYVFGHHEVRDLEIQMTFEASSFIKLSIAGRADVFGDEELSSDVPLRLECPTAMLIAAPHGPSEAIRRALAASGLRSVRLHADGDWVRVLPEGRRGG